MQWLTESAAGAYATKTIELCNSYANVYCGFGHFEEIMAHGCGALMKQRLVEALATTGEYDFADKIMYGSDWHISAAMKLRPDHYLAAWAELFGDEDLQPHASAFFRDNAARFLQLGD